MHVGIKYKRNHTYKQFHAQASYIVFNEKQLSLAVDLNRIKQVAYNFTVSIQCFKMSKLKHFILKIFVYIKN